MRRLFLCITVALCACVLQAGDTMQASALLKQAAAQRDISYPKTIELAQQALEKSRAAGWNAGICRALLIRASAHMHTTDLNAGKAEIEEAIALAEKSGLRELQLKGLFEMAGMYNLLGDYPKSMEYALRAEKLAKSIGQDIWLGQAILKVGVVHYYVGDHKKAAQAYDQALNLSTRARDTATISAVLSNQAIMACLGGDCNKSVGLFQRCIDLAQAAGDIPALAKYYSNLGNTRLYLNQNAEAFEDFKTSIAFCRQCGDKVQLALSLGNTAFALNALKRYPEAIKYARWSVDTAAMVGSLDDLKVGWKLLAELYHETGNHAEAYKAMLNYDLFKDSLAVDEKKSKIRNLEQKLEFSKREELQKANSAAAVQRQVWVRNIFIGGFTLAAAFAGVFLFQRRKTEKQRKRSDELLLNILPAEIAEELKATGTAGARQFDHVSVLFMDIVGFTRSAEQLDARELVAELDLIYSAFDEIVIKHGLEKIKTVGDAYIAVCGLPLPQEDHALRTIQASFDVLDFMAGYAAERQQAGRPYFELRIGIHSGPVVAGIVGKSKFAYDIWGDTVNTAARMEQNGEAGKINISGATELLVRNHIRSSYRGKIEAKNKGAVDMYFAVELL